MSSDAGERVPDGQRADFSLPRVVDVQIRATRFDPPPLRNLASALPRSDDAVEFIVRTDHPFPIRALGPVLFVGDTPVTEVSELAPNTYRFVALARGALRTDAPISIGWSGQSLGRRQPTEFRFRI